MSCTRTTVGIERWVSGEERTEVPATPRPPNARNRKCAIPAIPTGAGLAKS